MPKVTLLREHVAALDGVHPRTYAPGDELDVDDDVADSWTARGIAERADAPAPAARRRRSPAHTPKRETD